VARRNNKRGFPAKRFLLAAGLGLTAYFVHHTVYGRYGLSAHAQLTREARSLEAQIAALEAHRDHLKTDVKNLQDPPHPDLIEEGARRLLGYEKPATLRLNEPQVPR
jgi:cell division protein FtsB